MQVPLETVAGNCDSVPPWPRGNAIGRTMQAPTLRLTLPTRSRCRCCRRTCPSPTRGAEAWRHKDCTAWVGLRVEREARAAPEAAPGRQHRPVRDGVRAGVGQGAVAERLPDVTPAWGRLRFGEGESLAGAVIAALLHARGIRPLRELDELGTWIRSAVPPPRERSPRDKKLAGEALVAALRSSNSRRPTCRVRGYDSPGSFGSVRNSLPTRDGCRMSGRGPAAGRGTGGGDGRRRSGTERQGQDGRRRGGARRSLELPPAGR